MFFKIKKNFFLKKNFQKFFKYKILLSTSLRLPHPSAFARRGRRGGRRGASPGDPRRGCQWAPLGLQTPPFAPDSCRPKSASFLVTSRREKLPICNITRMHNRNKITRMCDSASGNVEGCSKGLSRLREAYPNMSLSLPRSWGKR